MFLYYSLLCVFPHIGHGINNRSAAKMISDHFKTKLDFCWNKTTLSSLIPTHLEFKVHKITNMKDKPERRPITAHSFTPDNPSMMTSASLQNIFKRYSTGGKETKKHSTVSVKQVTYYSNNDFHDLYGGRVSTWNKTQGNLEVFGVHSTVERRETLCVL